MRPPFVPLFIVPSFVEHRFVVPRSVARHSIAASLALLLVSGVVACASNEIVEGVSESTYVRAMVALRKLPTGAVPDSAARARTRDSVLGSLRITAAQLESAATSLARDPVRAARVWQAIEGAVPGKAR